MSRSATPTRRLFRSSTVPGASSDTLRPPDDPALTPAVSPTSQTQPRSAPFDSTLFCNTVAGVDVSARLYSLIETAKAHRLEPYTYLRHVFTEPPKA